MEGSDEVCLHNFFGNVLVPKVSQWLSDWRLPRGVGWGGDKLCQIKEVRMKFLLHLLLGYGSLQGKLLGKEKE